MGLVNFLKFPLWLLKLFVKRPRKKRNELEEKQRKHVQNFSIRHYSWQKSLGKDKRKKKKGNRKVNSPKKSKTWNRNWLKSNQNQLKISGQTIFLEVYSLAHV